MANNLDIERYRDRITSYKKVGNQIHIDRMQANIERGFHKSPSYFPVEINGEPREVHIVEGLEGNNFLLTKPDETVHVGDLVSWEDNTHMVINKRHNTTIQTRAEIQVCNEMLTWQDENLVTYQIPAILLDKTSVYSDGISKKKHISIGTDQISITVQTNELTKQIPIDKRFIFDHDKNNIYKVNRMDSILEKGLTLFVAKKDLYKIGEDRLDLNLANYKDPLKEPPIVDDDNTGEDLVVTGEKRLTIWDEDVEYSVNTTKPVEWTVEPKGILKITSSSGNKCTVSPVGTTNIGKVTLRAKVIDQKALFGDIELELFYQ